MKCNVKAKLHNVCAQQMRQVNIGLYDLPENMESDT